MSRSLLLGKHLSLCSSVHELQSKRVILSKGARSLSILIELFFCGNVDLNPVSFTKA